MEGPQNHTKTPQASHGVVFGEGCQKMLYVTAEKTRHSKRYVDCRPVERLISVHRDWNIVIVLTMKSKHHCRLQTYLMNARSVCNKLNDFRLFFDSSNLDIVAISETWLTPDIPNSMFVPTESYLCFRKDRQSGKGGGVFLMIKKVCVSLVIFFELRLLF